MNVKPLFPPSAKKVHTLVDYTNVALADENTEGYIANSEAKYYSDVTFREFYTKEQLEQHKAIQEARIAAEQVHDSQAVIAEATEEKDWIGNVI